MGQASRANLREVWAGGQDELPLKLRRALQVSVEACADGLRMVTRAAASTLPSAARDLSRSPTRASSTGDVTLGPKKH